MHNKMVEIPTSNFKAIFFIQLVKVRLKEKELLTMQMSCPQCSFLNLQRTFELNQVKGPKKVCFCHVISECLGFF